MIIHDRQIKAFFRNIAINTLVVLCVFCGQLAYEYYFKKELHTVKKKPVKTSPDRPAILMLKTTKISADFK